jgi:hypothetical protein
MDTTPCDGASYLEVFTSLEEVKGAILNFMRENNLGTELPVKLGFGSYEDGIHTFAGGMGFFILKMDTESFERLRQYFQGSE